MSGFQEVVAAYGDVEAVKRRFGYKTVQAVYNWKYRQIPLRKAKLIAKEKGIPLERLLTG